MSEPTSTLDIKIKFEYNSIYIKHLKKPKLFILMKLSRQCQCGIHLKMYQKKVFCFQIQIKVKLCNRKFFSEDLYGIQNL